MLARPFKVFAANSDTKNPRVKKIVETRKAHMKTIRKQLNKISSDEKERVKELFELHKELFSMSDSQEGELQVEVIDDFFEV